MTAFREVTRESLDFAAGDLGRAVFHCDPEHRRNPPSTRDLLAVMLEGALVTLGDTETVGKLSLDCDWRAVSSLVIAALGHVESAPAVALDFVREAWRVASKDAEGWK